MTNKLSIIVLIFLLVSINRVFAHEEKQDNSWWWSKEWWDTGKIETPENYDIETSWTEYSSEGAVSTNIFIAFKYCHISAIRLYFSTSTKARVYSTIYSFAQDGNNINCNLTIYLRWFPHIIYCILFHLDCGDRSYYGWCERFKI